MVEKDDILIPIKVKDDIFYLNESEYERNRLLYENSLDNWYNFLN